MQQDGHLSKSAARSWTQSGAPHPPRGLITLHHSFSWLGEQQLAPHGAWSQLPFNATLRLRGCCTRAGRSMAVAGVRSRYRKHAFPQSSVPRVRCERLRCR